MKLLFSAAILTLSLAHTIAASPRGRGHSKSNFAFTPVTPPSEEFSIKVPSELFIIMCENAEFAPPCDGGYVSPGLCYYTPNFGVSAVQPGQDISGCTLYHSNDCDYADGDLPNVAYPGIADLTADGFNDQVGSFICY